MPDASIRSWPSPPRRAGWPSDPRQYAPAAARNAAPILDVLSRHLPAAGTILEVGSGTGQHVVAFAAVASGADVAAERSGPGVARQHRRLDRGRRPRQRAPAARSRRDTDAGSAPSIAARRHRLHQPPARRAVVGLRGPDGGRRRRCSSRGAALPLRRFQTRRRPHRAEQRHVRSLLARVRPRLGRARPRGGGRAGAAHGLDLIEVVAMPSNNLSIILRRRPSPVGRRD